MFDTIKKSVWLSAALLCTLAVLAAPASAQPDFRIFGSLMDTDDLAEAFGGGLRVSFPINEKLDFDLSGSYYEDFKNRFEDNTSERISVELSTIPIDVGITWTRNGDSGFQFGGGLSYVYMDLNDLEIENMETAVTGDLDDEFGGYLKIGYQFKGGFYGELFYRLLEAEAENVLLGGVVPTEDRDIQLDGFALNLGYRF